MRKNEKGVYRKGGEEKGNSQSMKGVRKARTINVERNERSRGVRSHGTSDSL